MKFIKFFSDKCSPKEIPKLLGRWRIEKCHFQMGNKIDLSNEDHCGTCGQYALKKIKLIDQVKNNTQSKIVRCNSMIKKI